MPALFESIENFDSSKLLACVHTMPEQFENGKKFDGKNSLQDFDAKEMCLHHKNRSVSFQKRSKMFCFHHFRVFTRCLFKDVPVRVPFSKSTVFKICRQKNVPFRVNRRPICHIFTIFKMCRSFIFGVFFNKLLINQSTSHLIM